MSETLSLLPLSGLDSAHSLATVPYKMGSFWTAKQRQGHSLHEISYRACFKPQLVEYFIERLTREGDIVLDPFMGRGTTLLEAVIRNRVAYGSDINPLSQMLIEPRLSPPNIADVYARLKSIPSSAPIPREWEDLQVFFHENTLAHLVALKNWFIQREATGQIDAIDKWIRMVVINRLTGHSSGFLSVRTMPPNQAVSIAKQKEFNKKNNNTPTSKDVIEIIMKKSKSLLRSGRSPQHSHYKMDCCRADRLDFIQNEEVSLVLTSPPFLDVVDYAKDNWLRCWFAGIDETTIQMDIHRNIDDWCYFVSKTFTEFSRIVKKGGHVAFEVGDVRNGKIMLDKYVIKAIEGLAFRVVEVVVNQQQFTKTANCWGVNNNKGGTLTNRIVIAQKI